MGLSVFAIVLLIGLYILPDYARHEDFLPYRLAFNVGEGAGLVFNPSEQALPTLSPLFPLLISSTMPVIEILAQQRVPMSMMFILFTIGSGLAYALLSVTLWRSLEKRGFAGRYALAAVVLLLLTQPIWLGLRSASPLSLALILIALGLGEGGRWQWAGIIAGLATLSSSDGILGALVLGVYALVYEKPWHYWRWVWVPMFLWTVFAAQYYDDGLLNGLQAHRIATKGDTAQNILWLGVFLLSSAILAQLQAARWVWIFVLWAVLELGGRLLLHGGLMQMQSVVLALVIVLAIIHAAQKWTILVLPISGAVMIGLFILFPIQRDNTLAEDMTLSDNLYIGERNALLHDRTMGIIANLEDLTGDVYGWDGSHSPLLRDYIEREDYPSFIIATAPEFIYINDATLDAQGINLREDPLAALNYRREIDVRLDPGQREGDGFWFRDSQIGAFNAPTQIGQDLSPDIRLDSYALDRDRLRAGDVVRLVLNWELAQPAEASVSLQINLVNLQGEVIASTLPRYAMATWQDESFSTYHVFRIPPNTPTQAVDLRIAVNYEAEIIGNSSILQSSISSSDTDSLPANPIGQIAMVSLLDRNISVIEGGLAVNLIWTSSAPLEQDYQVLVHLLPLDAPQPAATGDGSPANGLFPTRYWQAGDIIQDPHQLNLAEVPPGDYEIRVGFYLLETFERLRDENGDSLAIANITIDEDGTVTIQELPDSQD